MKERVTLDQKIKILSDKLMTVDLSKLPSGLFSGKMGICIYYYHLARQTGEKTYENFAEKLLDDIYSSVNKNSGADIDHGLSGIGWGINYLVKNKFVEGDTNYILKDIDDQIFSTINAGWIEKTVTNNQDLIFLLYYLYERLKVQKKNSLDEYLYQQLIIKIINRLDYDFSGSFWKEPSYFNLKYALPSYLLILSRLFGLNFFNYKISQTLEELSSVVLSTFPVLHIHRLCLLLGIQSVLEQISIQAWQEHALLLEKNINHQKILLSELKNKNVYLNNGISGYVLLLNLWDKFNNNNNKENLLCIKPDIYKKIETSNCWEDEFPLGSETIWNVGLWKGFSGIALMYHLFLTS